jgi:tetratricopeptide (TPR) repeat protein
VPKKDSPHELPPAIHAKITGLSEEGNRLADAGDTLGAWKKFNEALALVPEPQTDWETTTWLVASIGDMAFQRQKYEKALDAFTDAVRCPGGLGNPFIHLRKGQCHFELNDMKRAADDLTRAYMGAGREIFKEEDPKYFQLLEQLLEPPAGQDRL